MNIFSRILPVIATIAVSMSCLSMMQEIEKFEKFNDLPIDVTHKAFPANLDAPTKRNFSATCTSLRKACPIEETEEYQKHLKVLSGDRALRIVSTEPIVEIMVGGQVEYLDRFAPIWLKNYNYIKMLFDVADAKMVPSDTLYAKRILLEASMPKSRGGAKHWMGMNLLRSAILEAHKTGDDKFATDLIKANPHNFCRAYQDWSGQSEMLFHITVLAPTYITNAEATKYVNLANKQPIYTPIKKSGDCTIL